MIFDGNCHSLASEIQSKMKNDNIGETLAHFHMTYQMWCIRMDNDKNRTELK